MNDLKVIRTYTWLSGDSVFRETVVESGRHRLQVRLEHALTQHQSSAVVKRWSGQRWERVAGIPANKMRSWLQKLHVHLHVDSFINPFDADEQELFATALQIVED